MTTKRSILNRDRLLLAAIFAVITSSTVAWTIADRTPPAWDPADHISAAYDYYRPLAHLDARGFAREFFIEPHYYAPFVHMVTALVFLITGASRLTGIVVNLISLGVLLASVYWIARTLYGRGLGASGKPGFLAGVIAALLAASYHFNAWLIHDAFLDYPLVALVTASFALLIRAGDFQSRRAALLFGLVAGLGLLTKQTFAFFFALPALYVAFKVVRARSPKAMLNLLLAAAVAVAVAAIWYLPHLKEVMEIYQVNKEAAINENEAPLLSFTSNVFYLHALVSGQMQLPFGILFAGSLAYSLARRRRESLMLYLWLLSGIGMFTLVANKDVRYTVPVLPAAAIICVCWLAELRPASSAEKSRAARLGFAFKSALAAAIVSWALVSFFNAQWPQPGMGFYLDTPRFRWMVFARNYYGFDHRPLADEWSVPDIVRSVASLPPARNVQATARASDEPERVNLEDGVEADRAPAETVSPQTFNQHEPGNAARPVLGVVVNLPHLNPSSIALYARLLTRERAGPPLINVDWLVVESAQDRVEGCDYLLVRTGLDQADWVAPVERYVEKLIRENPDRFARVASFPIPLQNAEAVIYRCGG